MIKLCKNCNKEFEPTTHNNLHCSKECTSIYNKKGNTDPDRIAAKLLIKEQREANWILHMKQSQEEHITKLVTKALIGLNKTYTKLFYTMIQKCMLDASSFDLVLLQQDIEVLRHYIENQFKPEMTWDNYGTYWSIVNIVPLDKLLNTRLNDKDRQSYVNFIFHYSNLQPILIYI